MLSMLVLVCKVQHLMFTQRGPVFNGRSYQGKKAPRQHSRWDPWDTQTPPPQ